MEDAELRHVTDSNGGHYELARQIGKGGQGAVYLCKSNPRVAVKVVRHATRHQAEKLRQQIASVKRMDLSRLPVARPVAMLAPPHVGYVMELATGMRAISMLFMPARDTASIREWYVTTGGMRRRLQILTRLAKTMAQIHGMGLAYGDPSPGNVLVSSALDGEQVFLIDCDNLRARSNPQDVVLFTPGYGAPEVVTSRSGINSLTDAHAFAVIAFQVLTLCHPLIGNAVINGDPSLEEAALRGEMPWIEHAGDPTNRSSHGIPREMILSPKLRSLFSTAFEAGLRDPSRRPGVAQWVEAFRTAAAVSVRCAECGWSYYYSATECPVCGQTRPVCLVARITVWNPDHGDSGGICVGPSKRPLVVGAAVGTANDPLVITPDQLGHNDDDNIVLVAALEQATITLTAPQDEGSLRIAHTPGQVIRPVTTKGQSFRLSNPNASVYVHAGDLAETHRVIRLTMLPGGVR